MPTEPSLTFVTRVEADIALAYVIGDLVVGVREVIPIVGRRFHGPALRSGVLPGGAANRCLVRPDGSCDIWVRYTLKIGSLLTRASGTCACLEFRVS